MTYEEKHIESDNVDLEHMKMDRKYLMMFVEYEKFGNHIPFEELEKKHERFDIDMMTKVAKRYNFFRHFGHPDKKYFVWDPITYNLAVAQVSTRIRKLEEGIDEKGNKISWWHNPNPWLMLFVGWLLGLLTSFLNTKFT